MPTYSYRCNACGHLFEKVQRITEDPIKECPACRVEAAARQIQSGNFILKGGGWYGDLYSGGSNKKTSAASDAGSTPASSAPALSSGGSNKKPPASSDTSTGPPSSAGSPACGDTGGCAAPACPVAPSTATNTSN